MDFREFLTSSGKQVLAGKSAETNEKLIAQVEKDEVVLHTEKPGSPFVNIKSDKPKKEDIKEAAVFCGAYSQIWKKANRKPGEIEVHYFLGRDIFKLQGMKTGTFGVKKMKRIIIKKEEIEKFEENKNV